jgi:hypothetical protein
MLSVSWDCQDVGQVAHQIGHAIGFWHENNRPDRDSYVQIQQHNIKPKYLEYFKKLSGISGQSAKLLDLGYDFESIMHFSNTSYSRGQRLSIRARQKWRREGFNLGQRHNLSHLDIKRVNLLYSCPAGRYAYCTLHPLCLGGLKLCAW